MKTVFCEMWASPAAIISPPRPTESAKTAPISARPPSSAPGTEETGTVMPRAATTSPRVRNSSRLLRTAKAVKPRR